MSRASNNPANWETADNKTVEELVHENRETFETVAKADTWFGNLVERLIREVDGRD